MWRFSIQKNNSTLPAVSSFVLLLVGMLILTGCGAPIYRAEQRHTNKTELVEIALDLLGEPYQYGGNSPESGFDCSGLVQYVYKQVGVELPRTSRELYRNTLPITRRSLRPGDLIFFHTRRSRFVSHVGIYLGDGEFVHAPSSGKEVSIARLDQSYWQRRYFAAGRID